MKKNPVTKSKLMKNLIVVPLKFIKSFIHLYHINTGHKGYHNLAAIITYDGFYIKVLYIKINEETNNCIIWNKNKKKFS